MGGRLTATAPPAAGGGASGVPVVVNGAAGLGRRDRVSEVEAALREAGVAARVEAVRPDDVGGRVRGMRDAGVPLVGVAGGDGTMLAAADVLAGSDTVLAPLPTGTLNHFARRLGLDDLSRGAEAIRDDESAQVPLGVVDDRLFMNTATFGFYADVVRRRESYRPRLGKWGAAGVAFTVTLARLRTMDVTLVVDGERLERRTALVWVGVGWGSFPLVHESPDRRRLPDLEIVVLRPGGVAATTRLIARLLLSLRRRDRPISDPALEIFHARQLLISAAHRIGVTLDGEVLRCTPPVLVGVQPDALRVVVPAARQGG